MLTLINLIYSLNHKILLDKAHTVNLAWRGRVPDALKEHGFETVCGFVPRHDPIQI